MVAFQTNYNYYTDTPYLEGTIATNALCQTRSFLNETGEVLPYGLAMIYNPATQRYELPSATGQLFRGIVIRRDIREFASRIYDPGGADVELYGYPVDERDCERITFGDVAVYMETAFSPDLPVFFRHTANGVGLEVPGRFRTDADTGNADEIVGAEIQNSGVAGEIALITLK